MVTLFPHNKQVSKEFQRLNALVLRQSADLRRSNESQSKLQQQVSELTKKADK